VQVLEYLGVSLNSLEGTMLIPDSRICKALDTISVTFHAIKIHRRAPARKLASIVGQIISMSLVLGHLSQIMTRYTLPLFHPFLFNFASFYSPVV